MQQIIIGIDDTDTLETRGTGHLARMLAERLAQHNHLHGVTRHQLLQDSRVPMTAKNSCAAILLESAAPLEKIAAVVRQVMLDDFKPGSDPGLCVTTHVPAEVTAFGGRAQKEFLYQQEARSLAAEHGILLEGLGGDENGVIGALAAVGLAACGNDGRYVQVGSMRTLSGLQPVSVVLAAGIAAVQTLQGETIHTGRVMTDKMRPARRNGQPVLFVELQDDDWFPLKLD